METNKLSKSKESVIPSKVQEQQVNLVIRVSSFVHSSIPCLTFELSNTELDQADIQTEVYLIHYTYIIVLQVVLFSGEVNWDFKGMKNSAPFPIQVLAAGDISLVHFSKKVLIL